jgi:predicted MFS family arabinose efflux permease
LPRRPAPATDRSASYRQVFAQREFSLLLLSHAVTLLGDQALRVALALLVYHDTGSPLLTAFGYSLTFLPWLVAGPLLSGLVDRLPRRSVLVVGNLVRAVLVACMTIPRLPVAGVLGLLLVAELLEPPVDAAAFAVLPELLIGDSYVIAVSLNQAVIQGSQIIGFGIGGAVVGQIGARAAFGVDAASFLIAAVLYRLALHSPYPPPEGGERSSFWSDTREGFQAAMSLPAPRTLLLLGWWGALVLLVPEALAAPLVAKVTHGGDTATGLVLAAQPAGMIVGMVLLGRLTRPSRRRRLMRPLAVVGAAPLIGFALKPSLPVALVLLALSGMAWSYQVPLQAAFVEVIPAEMRGRAFGIAAAGIQVAQGIGVLAGGLLAELYGVTTAITTAGVVGVAVMLVIASRQPPVPTPATAT